MTDWERVQQLARQYNLVLVDNSVVASPSGLAEKLYTCQTMGGLDRLCTEMKAAEQDIKAGTSLFSMNHVLTLKEVRQETAALTTHLQTIQNKLRNHYQEIKLLRYSRERAPLNRLSRGKGKKVSRRINKCVEKIRASKKEQEEVTYLLSFEEMAGWCALEGLREALDEMLSAARIYDGPTCELPRVVIDASNTDYKLMEAGLGYALAHPQEEVLILSNDYDLVQIIKHYFRDESKRDPSLKRRIRIIQPGLLLPLETAGETPNSALGEEQRI